MALLTKHHATEPGTSVATATLLLTDRRWRGGVGQLVRELADAGLLTPEQLDGLALAFLAADRYVYWPVPDAWFTAESVALVVSHDVDEDADKVAVSEGPAVAARDVAPPLRRWAAARLVAPEPAARPRLLARAQDLDARHGAAVVAGMFDSIGLMPAAAQAWLVTKGTTWPHQSVRRAALRSSRPATVRTWLLSLRTQIQTPRSGPGRPPLVPPDPERQD